MICFGNCSFRPLHLSHLRDNPIWPWLHFWLRPWWTWVPLPGWSGTPYGNREFHSGRLAAAPGYWLKLRFYDTNYVALSTKNQAKSQLWWFMPVYSHVPIFSSQFVFFFMVDDGLSSSSPSARHAGIGLFRALAVSPLWRHWMQRIRSWGKVERHHWKFGISLDYNLPSWGISCGLRLDSVGKITSIPLEW